MEQRKFDSRPLHCQSAQPGVDIAVEAVVGLEFRHVQSVS